MSTFIVISNSLSAPASRVREGQANGTLEALLTTPPRGSQLFLAAGAYDVLRSVVTSAVTLAAAVVVFGLSITANAAATAALAVGLLGGVVAGSALGLVIAAATLVLRRGDTLTGFAVTILALGSGVYYPTDVLPQGLRQIADALPTAWAVDLARVGLLDGKFQAWQAAGLAVAASLMLVASTVVLEASLRYARRQGTLARV
jgi:ABC-type polysaccharide/polyol phosphate export permease